MKKHKTVLKGCGKFKDMQEYLALYNAFQKNKVQKQ